MNNHEALMNFIGAVGEIGDAEMLTTTDFQAAQLLGLAAIGVELKNLNDVLNHIADDGFEIVRD